MSKQPPQAGGPPPPRARNVNFLRNERQTEPGAPAGGAGGGTTAAPIERVNTIPQEDGTHTWSMAAQAEQARPRLLPPKKSKPAARCVIACCILSSLLVIAVGFSVLVVYLLYRPQPPRLGVATATLNAGYLDKLNGGLALNSDLTLLATISNPNTKIDVVLHYIQLDLLFRGNMIATQAVWPAPLHEGPGGSVLRSVRLVTSEVTMTQEDAVVWQNATSKGGPVPLQLVGRFRTQLNFGRWLRYTYWVNPRCNLRLDPPPSGALRLAQC